MNAVGVGSGAPVRAGKVRTAAEAIQAIVAGATVVVTGSGGRVNEPDLLLTALEERFLATGQPADLTLYHPNGMGDGQGGGTEHFAHPGFVRCVYGSHWSWAPRLSRMALDGAFETAVWPQGVLAQLLRESAAGRPGLLTHVGIGSSLDPRVGGGRPGARPQVVQLDGRDWLYYPAPRVDVALIRATTADEAGNLSFEHEGVILDTLTAAQAAHSAGGIVIAQVKRLACAGSLDPRLVRVPGYLVDAIVVAPEQRQSAATAYNPGYSGELRIAVPDRPVDQLERRLIARRAALELRPGMVVNLGFGVADGVATVAAEEGIVDDITLSVEQGASGGIPAWDADFGLMWNPTAILDAPSQFDFYDGGGLDLAIVSFAQVDGWGNVNVSYFDGRLIGPGGFLNITQNATTVIFCGTFMAKGLHVDVRDGQLVVAREGTVPKFVERVDEITFSGAAARARGQAVLYVTERAVFRLGVQGLELIEVAPGIDVAVHILPHMAVQPALPARIARTPAEVYGGTTLGLAGRFRAAQPSLDGTCGARSREGTAVVERPGSAGKGTGICP
jgi:acyl CoA:acetate/3-ketoacid CoA transferase